jgi:tRNA/tmRNA/rRNA uracil-C5-methylase (TrmA/RlmC/RlmD family)
MLADLYTNVIGIESVSEALDDAVNNADLNRRENITYLNKRVEECTKELMESSPETQFVAVLYVIL